MTCLVNHLKISALKDTTLLDAPSVQCMEILTAVLMVNILRSMMLQFNAITTVKVIKELKCYSFVHICY